MEWIAGMALVLAAVVAGLAGAFLTERGWRRRRREQERSARLLNAVYNQQERRRRGE